MYVILAYFFYHDSGSGSGSKWQQWYFVLSIARSGEALKLAMSTLSCSRVSNRGHLEASNLFCRSPRLPDQRRSDNGASPSRGSSEARNRPQQENWMMRCQRDRPPKEAPELLNVSDDRLFMACLRCGAMGPNSLCRCMLYMLLYMLYAVCCMLHYCHLQIRQYCNIGGPQGSSPKAQGSRLKAQALPKGNNPANSPRSCSGNRDP